MTHKFFTTLSLVVLVILLIAGLWALTAYYADLPQRVSQHETIVFGQNRFVPGSQAAMRVVVRDSKDASPLSGAQIRVSMKPASGGRAVPLFSGLTDGQGTANISFRVPSEAAPDQTLVVETRSSLGSDFVERPVTLQRDYRLLLTSDKPLYQPGQVIHLRALALSTFDLTPAAGQELEFVIADGKGNKVFRKKLPTSEFGVAAVDFQLASEVNTGPYKISAVMGKTSSEKTVTVEHYVLPKFAVKLSTEKTFYQPGQHVKGSLNAGYFFGKPVAGGQVLLEGYTFDVQRNVAVSLQGVTDEQGNFYFEFDLPGYITGSELEAGMGRFYLQATVTDLAQHSETSNLSLPIAHSSLVIEAIPEGGQFRQGVENILYVFTSYPDGTPAETNLRLTFYNNNQSLQAHTGPYGLAEVRLTPDYPSQAFLVEASDAQGNLSQREFQYEGQYAEESVLLRPDQPVYRVGDTMNLTILTSQLSGTVYLDIVREGQTVSTRSVEIRDGRGEAAIDLTPDLYGTLELHAYKILRSGSISRDTRLVVVDNAQDLNVSLTPECGGGSSEGCVFRPGDDAGLNVQVSGQDGQGVRSVLGLSIVDESVFALAEQDPGFAKLYFLLEQQILQPRYDLHGFSVPDLISPASGLDTTGNPNLQRAVEDAAQASLAAAVPQGASFSLQANSHEDAIQRARQSQQKYFTNLGKGTYALALLLPLTALFLSAIALWRQKNLGRSLALLLGLALLALLLFLVWPLEQARWWAQTPLDRLEIIFSWASRSGEELVLSLTLAGLLGYLVLVVAAWRQKDRLMGWTLGLLPLFFILLGFSLYAYSRSNSAPGTLLFGLGLLAFSLLPVAFLMRAAGYTWRRRMLPALGALLVAAFLLVAALPALAMGTSQAFVSSRNNLDMLGGRGGGLVVEEAVPLMAVQAPAPTAAAAIDAAQIAGKPAPVEAPAAHPAQEPPRLRQFFPETMFWLPEAVTAGDGTLHLDVPVADSITTWRMTALASTQDGRLGSATGSLRVFQDFFIDLDLPPALTVGDEVAVPVGVYNYLPSEQTVRLELEQSGWFELLDEPVKEIRIASNDISVVYFRVRASQFGRQPFKVTATGSQMSDAIQKEVRVFPDGKQITFTHSDRLSVGAPVEQAVSIPAGAIPGTQSLVVKIYPGVLSQVVEGLDSILRMPFGCFEQTSSTTYPNVLVLDYLKSTNQASPELQLKAEEYINLGYQRLTTFEVGSSGGFSLFGQEPADRMLTGYGLQEFSDMSRVYEVDPALVQHAAQWLLSQQKGDGSWENDRGLVHESTWSNLGNDHLPVTAYLAWSLVEAGFGDDPRTQKGLAYVRENQLQVEDPYVLALVANALVASDLSSEEKLAPATVAVLDRLAGMAIQQGSSAYWQSGVATFMGSQGQTGSIETTALAALAFLRSGSHPELANAALTYLIQQKDGFGTWNTTQATVLALKALIQSVRAGSENVDARVQVSLNGGQTRTIQVTLENFDVVQLVSFEDVNPGKDNRVEIQAEGQGNLMYQVTGSYYLPWKELSQYPQATGEKDLVTIDVAYDRTELAVNDTVRVDVSVRLNQPGGRAESALIDLGLPPGFAVQAEDLEALVAHSRDVPADYPFATIQRYELTGRQILVYVSNLSADQPLQFSYHLRAKFPLVAQTPASNAYDYYNPDVSGETAPQTLVVNP